MAILDEIIEEISKRDSGNIVYKTVYTSYDVDYELNHDDRVKEKFGRSRMVGCGLTFRHDSKMTDGGYRLAKPICSVCGAKTFLNEDDEEFYCPVHCNE